MLTEQQLKWIQENRRRGRGVQTAGEVASKILEAATFRGPGNSDKIQQVLDAVLGSVLAEHCHVGQRQRGTQVIYVDDPTVRYRLHSEYREVVLAAMTERGVGHGIRAVRFALGRPNSR